LFPNAPHPHDTQLFLIKYSDEKTLSPLKTKNGNVDLHINDYENLLKDVGDEVWLATSGGKVYTSVENAEQHQIVQYKKENDSFVKSSFDISVLVDFVFDKTKHSILPESILTLISMFELRL